nr:hypothetical protein PCC_0545 [Paulinella chromatophora]ACB42976.1 hypothetical protein PCC_0545 [Paulinella chromatophora]
MYVRPSTFNLLNNYEELISSLRQQPILVVIRPNNFTSTHRQLRALSSAGYRHIELSWKPIPYWEDWVRYWQREFPYLIFGAASIISIEGLEAAHRLGLRYCVTPVLNKFLLSRSRKMKILLIPGVFSPSEIHEAILMRCKIIKLFPARLLGPDYWRQLRSPLGSLPFCLAAGGLSVNDIPLWLRAGVDAVVLGRQLFASSNPVKPILTPLSYQLR